MSSVKWIKITTDIFDDEKIKLIDAMPDRDSLIVIWFKLLTLAGKTNANGLVYISEKIPTTDEMLSTLFNRPLNTIRLALKIFSDLKMIEVKEHISIVNWSKHQNISGLEKIKEQNKIRQRNYRERQKLLKCNVTDDVTSNVKRNGHRYRIRIENKNKNKIQESNSTEEYVGYQENNIHSNNITCRVSDETTTTCLSECEIIIDFLNEKSGRSFRSNNKSTVSMIKARLKEGYTLDDFKSVIRSKCLEWKDNPEMRQYLQPSTLFAPSKFEKYLVKAKEEKENSRRRKRTSDKKVFKIS